MKSQRRRPESELQEAVMRWWKLAHRGLGIRHEEALIHVANQGRIGGRRGFVQGAILKRMGVRACVPDLLLVAMRAIGPSRQVCGALWIELKAKGGEVSPEQERMHLVLRTLGHAVVVAWSFDEAVDLITGYVRSPER